MCGFVRDFASLRRRAVDAVDQALCSSMLSSAGRAVVALVCVYVRVCVRVCVSVCVAVLGSGCKSIALSSIAAGWAGVERAILQKLI